MTSKTNNFEFDLRDETRHIFEIAVQHYINKHRFNDLTDGVEFGYGMLAAEYRAGLKCIDKHISDDKFVSIKSRNLILTSVDDFYQSVKVSFPLIASVVEDYIVSVKDKSYDLNNI